MRRVSATTSSFDKLRMRPIGEGYGLHDDAIESLILSLSKDGAFGPATVQP